MQVFFGLDAIPRFYRDAVVTLGVYDGLHRAHMEIVNRVIEAARSQNTYSILVTFNPHPRSVLAQAPDQPVPLLTTYKEKMRLLGDTGLDAALFLEVNMDFLQQTAEKFVESVLVQQLRVRQLIVGYDYHFGRDRRGTAGYLSQLGDTYGFGVEIVDPVLIGDVTVRSSLIRDLLLKGEVAAAARYLGRPYGISGFVVHGAGRGQRLGFPTANLQPDNPDKLVPADGVYLCRVIVNEEVHYGITNVGIRSTFQESGRVIESFLLNTNGLHLYGAPLEIFFLERIRDERKFPDEEQLREQMVEDRKICIEKIKQYRE